MRKIVAVGALSVLLCVAAGASIGWLRAAESSDVTLTGEVLDLACYIGHGAKGPDHASCAAKCAEMGQPIGLAASDGKVYILIADHADSSPFTKAKSMAGKKVEIKGEVAAKDGLNALTVHAVKTV
jgi:hypothetical protein